MNKKQLIVFIILIFSLVACTSGICLFVEVPFKMPSDFEGAKDNNNDGKVDEIYIKEGYSEILKEDTNYDGRVDQIGYYYNEQLIKMEKDFDSDGKPDYRFWYKNGKLVKTEKISKLWTAFVS